MFINSYLLNRYSLLKVLDVNIGTELLAYDGYSINSTNVENVSGIVGKPYYLVTINTGEQFIIKGDSTLKTAIYPNETYSFLNPIQISTALNEQNISIYNIDSLAFISPHCTPYTIRSNKGPCSYNIAEGVITIPSVNKQAIDFEDTDLCNLPPYWYGILLTSKIWGSPSNPQIDTSLEIFNNLRDICGSTQNISVYKGNNNRIGFSGSNIETVFTDAGITNVLLSQRRIDSKYIFTSIKNRQLLVQGILDNIGSIDLANEVVTVTLIENPTLLKDLALLINTLGGETIFRSEYTLEVQLPKHLYPFKIPSKTALYEPQDIIHYPRYIVSVQPLGYRHSKVLYTTSPTNTVLLLDNNNSMYIPIST
jgi:hypothetical protein